MQPYNPTSFPLFSYKMSVDNQLLTLYLIGEQKKDGLDTPIDIHSLKTCLTNRGLTENSVKAVNFILDTFVEIGFLRAGIGGQIYAGRETVNYYQQIENKIIGAERVFNSILQSSWFFVVLMMALQEKKHLNDNEAKKILEQQIGIEIKGNERTNLGTSITMLVKAGLLLEISGNYRISPDFRMETLSVSGNPSLVTESPNFTETLEKTKVTSIMGKPWESGNLTSGTTFELHINGEVTRKDIDLLMKRLEISKEGL